MAADAIACLVRMLVCEFCLRVTCQASVAEVPYRIRGFVVGVMTGSTPHPCAAVDFALAQRKLLGVTDHLEAHFCAFSGFIVVDSEGLLQPLARFEIAESLARIHDPCHTHKVALLADAVSSPWLQFGRVDYVLWPGLRHVRDCGPMATAASDREMRERYFAVLVLRSDDRIE